MSRLTLYRAERDPWNSKIDPTINSVFSDQYLPLQSANGLMALNAASKEMGGGMLSTRYDVPTGTQHFGLDVAFSVSADDFPHLARNEMDLKITVKSASGNPAPNQANGSMQQNASKGWVWQLDPDGKGWVDSGYAPGPPKIGVVNTMQARFWTDGSKWSVMGLRMNGGDVFKPGAQFQNLPMITTDWAAGLKPQLQTEAQQVPWFLRMTYPRVWIMASDDVIPFDLNT